LTTDSKAQAEQLGAVAIARISELVGERPEAIITSIDQALRLHLAL